MTTANNAEVGADYDVAIIGAGPAGSALAAELARRGRRLVVLERERFPRDKLCGEFLSGEARGYLEQLGCLQEVLAAGARPIRRARFTTPRGRAIEFELPEEALGISRRALDFVLLRHAEHLGASVRAPAVVRRVLTSPGVSPDAPWSVAVDVRRLDHDRSASDERVRAALAVGAYGRRSVLDRQLGRRYLGKRHPYVGLKRHHRPVAGDRGEELREELDGVVEIHTVGGGYCGLSCVEDGRVNACALLEERVFQRSRWKGWDCVREELGRANRWLGRRLRALEPADDVVQSVAGVPFAGKERCRGPLLFVGDAAGMIAPLSGDGQAMALSSAGLLAQLIAEFPVRPRAADFAELSRRWERRWRREFGVRMRLGRSIQSVLLRSWTAEAAALALGLLPRLAPFLTRATRGTVADWPARPSSPS